MRKVACALLLASILPTLGTANAGSSLSGLWDARVQLGALEVPFRFGIAVRGDQVSGWFFNGKERVISSGGTLIDGHLTLSFASYAKRLDVIVKTDGTLSGTYAPTAPGSAAPTYPFQAQRATAAPKVANADVPHIEGLWLVPAQSQKANEKAWRLIVRQTGADVSAAILRVDGDTGALTGRWDRGTLLLSHFDGARPSVIEVTAEPDATLHLHLHNPRDDVVLIAYRASDARTKGLPAAADPARHTRVADAGPPFQFTFPNLKGEPVSNSDRRFAGKVLIVDVSGSWCPNCHDEAPFLESLYRKYRLRGMEVVTLSFEEPEQLENPERLRAFIRDYGIDYTVLLAGTPQELHSKLPQAQDLDAFPTTFFIGRDGRVRAVHAGFAASATGEFNVRLKKDFTTLIEQLLAEKPPAPTVAAVARQ